VTFVNAPALGRATRGVQADIGTATESPITAAWSACGVISTVRDQRRGRAIGPAAGREDRPDQRAANFDLRPEGIVSQLHRPAGDARRIGTLLVPTDINIHAAQLREDAEGRARQILAAHRRGVPAGCPRRDHEAVGAKLLEVVDLGGVVKFFIGDHCR